MSLKSIFDVISSGQECIALTNTLKSGSSNPGRPQTISLRNVSGSLPAFLVAGICRRTKRTVFCILENEETATYFHSDVQQILGSEDAVLLLPESGNKPFDDEVVTDPTPMIQRTDILQQLSSGFSGVVITHIEAVLEKVPSGSVLEQSTKKLQIGDTYEPESLIEELVGQGFTRVEFVERAGDLALRGGILDVFPFNGDFPVRMEFFGDEIESIREFDIHTQRSVSRLQDARLVPDLNNISQSTDNLISIFEYLSDDTILILQNDAVLQEHVQEAFESVKTLAEASVHDDIQASDIVLDPAEIASQIAQRTCISFGPFQNKSTDSFDFKSVPQPSFNSAVAVLRKKLIANHQQDIQTIILCDTSGQEGRIHDLLEDDIDRLSVRIQRDSLHEGFEIPSSGLAVYTDHQIFNRYHRPSTKRQKQRFGGLSLRELHHLVPGDFVVHIDYGIGRFSGMQEIDVNGKKQEVLRIEYQSTDILYVNVNALYKLHKYKGKEGHQPRLTKLGTEQWEKAKSRTKSRLKDIARDLIKLYAQRKQADGHAFPEDTVWQRELEASFKYEDTPDQYAASEAVKADMQEPVPMDRLVCGDVGFGKTEIAIRAAFKAVQDGKQVAVLVPTTVLAMQHFKTFSERLSAYPVRVSVLSRMRGTAEIKQTIKEIAAGEADIIIGTHRLISKDVKFQDLGLLVIDEEQRFGVGVKEKLRQLRISVDTLTLTATPIPRTLQFSLLGARDLTIISTPPANRQPIVSEIHTYDKDLIRDAIIYEVKRGGQVFFIHNRVQSIDAMAGTLRMMIPNVRFAVGHGQMRGPELEKVMTGFYEKKFDVLVCTSIIENGVDVSNANTMIINRADRFGLAELHQLRGRVGRSDTKAFCYLLVPSVKGLTRDAKQRLQIVEEFTALGSGFHIAMRDLDIRGAGNLLGAEQTGFVDDVGFDTYHKILDEAVEELRNTEFADLFGGEKIPSPGDTSVDVEADALIPESYLSNRVERLNIYRQISDARENKVLDEIKIALADRFGEPPVEVNNLLTTMRLKLSAQQLRLQRIVFKNQRLFLVFPDPEKDKYFYDYIFRSLLEKLDSTGYRFVLKESKAGRLRAIIQEVSDLGTGAEIIESLTESALQPAASTVN
ncbi:MAG: transcription-repair coupling factor [Bacteroidetes bacterium]|nr:MAG: transcription-repair coupling factor [Bacteroidota bacterium]